MQYRGLRNRAFSSGGDSRVERIYELLMFAEGLREREFARSDCLEKLESNSAKHYRRTARLRRALYQARMEERTKLIEQFVKVGYDAGFRAGQERERREAI